MSSPRAAVLMLLSRHPYAEKSGRGLMLRQRIEQIGRAFTTRIVVFGAPAGDASDDGLTFLPLAAPGAAALNAAQLGRLPLQTWLYHSAASRRRVAELAASTHAAAVYIDMLRLAPLARDIPASVARIVDYDDLLSARYRLAAADGYDVMGFLGRRVGLLAGVARAFAKPLLRAEAARCARYEQEMLGDADVAIFTSPREAQTMQGGRAHVLAAPPEASPRAAANAPGGRLIFLGNMRYAENVTMLRSLADAAAALSAEGAWPTDARIEAIGDHTPHLAQQLAAGPIDFRGRIEDLDALAGAGVFLAPVTSGSGVKIKVLDGMALGCPVVATPKALEGLSARANRDLIVAPDPKAVLAAALSLRDRPRLKAMLARRAQDYLARAHAASIGDDVCAAIGAAIERKRQETL